MSQKILTNKEIIKKLKSISGIESASELARQLGTERQNLKSYENKQSVDLNNRIISLLMRLMKEKL